MSARVLGCVGATPLVPVDPRRAGAVNPSGRFAAHTSKPWWRDVTRIDLVRCGSRKESFDLERRIILDENPRYNRARPPRMPEIRLVGPDA